MRLAPSLGFWLAGSTTVLLGLHGWVQVRVERADLLTAARRELTLVATAVRSAVENAVRDGQHPDVTRLLEELELRDPAVDIFVFAGSGELTASSEGSDGNLARARAVIQETADVKQGNSHLRLDDADPAHLVAVAPIRVPRDAAGHLVIFRPTDTLREDLASERQAVVFSIAGLIAAMSLVIWVVIHLRLHRPLSRITDGIRRIAGGDLSVRLGLSGTDEVVALAAEFDTMTDALEQAHLHLARAAETRERLETELQRSNKLVVVGQLAAAMAHEIGSPLQVLNGRARALAAREDLPADARRNAAILVEQTERVVQIVERLLDVARRKEPRLDGVVDIAEQVRLVVELLGPQARRAGVRLELDLAEALRPIRADAGQIQQVLLNLLQNALHACAGAGAGGGRVRVTAAPSSFMLQSTTEPRPSVAIAVDDSGPGIAEELRDRLFEPFFTAWLGDSDRAATGLGLSVVQSIVAAHGGAVAVTRAPPGASTRFTVHFPATAAPLTEDPEAR